MDSAESRILMAATGLHREHPGVHSWGDTVAQPNILVVDDNYPMARAMTFLLSRAGFACRIARDGLDAIEQIQEQKPDLVLLDLQMPRMDGLETCRWIRRCPEYGDLHVIVVTALGDDEDLARALEAGANECLFKPLNPPDLLRRIEEILRPEAAGHPSLDNA
jgi:DNA-binding response OmpR family regulator